MMMAVALSVETMFTAIRWRSLAPVSGLNLLVFLFSSVY